MPIAPIESVHTCKIPPLKVWSHTGNTTKTLENELGSQKGHYGTTVLDVGSIKLVLGNREASG